VTSAIATQKPRVVITHHPSGMAHTKSTIATMCRLAREGSHSYPIRSAATKIVHDVPSKQVRLELEALYRWVRDHIRYRFDPLGLEWVQSPARTLAEQAGDCDDMATLLAALSGSLGHRWRFVTVGPTQTVMKHVAAQVWDGSGWVTLDPVLEPPSTSTAPRGDAGMFGKTAPARARLTWSSEGRMLSGPVNSSGVALWEGKLGNARLVHVEPRARAHRMLSARRARGLSGLGGAVSPEQRDLWSWDGMYYPTDPNRIPGPAPIPNLNFRSSDAPGAQRVVVSAPPGALSGGLGYIDGLGWGFLKKIGKAIGGVAKGVAKVVTKIPGVSLAANLLPGGGIAMSALKAIGGKGKAKAKVSAGGTVSAKIATPVKVSSAYAPGSACAPPPASRQDLDALRNEIKFAAGMCTHADLSALQALVKARCMAPAEAKKLASNAVKTARARDAKSHARAIAKLRAGQKKAIAKLSKKLKCKACSSNGKAKKFPAGSRQIFDFKLNKYVVYAPASSAEKARATLSGLGFLKPTLSLTLGSTFGAFGLATAAQASTAVKSVTAFIQKKGEPPKMRLGEVLAFQKADGKLSADGIWGNNARAAAAWYLGKQVSSMPTVAKPFAKGKVTWKAPAKTPPVIAAKAAAKTVAKPKALPKPVPKPVPKGIPAAKPRTAAIKVAAKPRSTAPLVIVPRRREPPPAPYTAPVRLGPSVAKADGVPKVPGMVAQGTSSTDPGLPPIDTAPGNVWWQRSGGPWEIMPKDSQGLPRDDKGRVVVDVSGPTVRSSGVSPMLWMSLGLALLQRRRRAA
jgi:hypothetical protein